MPLLHKNSIEENKHTPKGFTNASDMSVLIRDEKGESTYTPNQVLPAAINFVDGNAPPPTTVDGDIYVLVDEGNGAVDSGWDDGGYDDWVRYDGTLWYEITPAERYLCYDLTASAWKKFDGTDWVLLVPEAPNIYTTDDSLTGSRTVTMGANTLTFTGNTTILQGENATSSDSVLQLFNTDTSDVKLWDFRNNGDVYSGVDDWTIYNDTLPLLSSHKINSGHNQFIIGEADTPRTPTTNRISHNFVGFQGRTSIPDNDFSFYHMLFENSGGITTFFAGNSGTTQAVYLAAGAQNDSIGFVHDTDKYSILIDRSSYVYSYHKGSGHWFGITSTQNRGSDFDSGVNWACDVDMQLYISDASSGATTRESPDLRFRSSYWNGSAAVKGEVKLGSFTDTSGNYGLDFKNESDTVGFKINGADALPMLPEYTVAGVPAADANNAGGVVAITDETGGYVLAFSDGTNWRRSTDRAIIS
jgi:hypothetical protein